MITEECELLRRRFLVRVREVSVNFSDQNPAVAVPEPLRNGHEVEPSHHALRCEEVAEIVKSKSRQAGFLAHEVE